MEAARAINRFSKNEGHNQIYLPGGFREDTGSVLATRLSRASSLALAISGAYQPRLAGRLDAVRDLSPPYSLEKMTDLVAVWDVALSDGVHKIEFEHGTTSGKRVVYVDGKEEIRKEWMFKLVGKETFCVGAAKTKATINIDAISGFAYEYTLEINGKSLKKYMENRSKTTNTWVLHLDGEDFRVVLEKDTMDVWCNGKRMETAGEFVDDGTETHFSVGNHDCYIKAVSSGKRKEGIIHSLIVDDREIPEILE
ncbi:fas apoptotic inhibitory molecule 1 isoform X1 [Acinonyx jubatus]|uniref:Fas apoptotic inhibitory molecule 1 n=4 Tax=Felinae TaxID=338152 RepID=A0A6J0A2N5_ACIJB|nr:fas apoptotic inhibitory molecule 1 isoform X1 [Acinonyx jubatus]